MKPDKSSRSPSEDVFHAIADPNRRRLLDLLAGGESPVNRLARGFPMSRPAVSQHLGVLLRAGLVAERRSGRERLYRLSAAALQDVHEWAGRHRRQWEERLDTLRDHLWRNQ